MKESEGLMKKSDVIKLLAMLSAAYPNMKEVTNITVDIWYDCLKDIDSNVALTAIKKHILESPFPPVVADIRKQIAAVTTPLEDRLDSSEAWGEVISAMKNYGSYEETEALKSMSPTTRKVVKYMSWREMCLSEKLGVTRGQFLKMYETVAQREEQNRLLPGDMKNKIGELTKLANKMNMNNMLEGDSK